MGADHRLDQCRVVAGLDPPAAIILNNRLDLVADSAEGGPDDADGYAGVGR